MAIRRLALLVVASLMVVAVMLAVAAGATAVRQHASAALSIDISGPWHIGAENFALDCTASITQNETALQIDALCGVYGEILLQGTIDQETGAFSAAGDVLGLAISVTGQATNDSLTGDFFVDLQGTPVSGTFTGTRLVPTPTATPTRTPAGPPPADISGPWHFDMLGDGTDICSIVIQKHTNALTGVGLCPFIGLNLDFEGIIYETGEFTLDGNFFTFAGSVSADGQITGTWQLEFLEHDPRPFTATRADESELVDLSGDWELFAGGDVSDSCHLHIDQELLVGNATFACGTLPSIQVTGSTNPLIGLIELGDPRDDQAFVLRGTESESKGFLQGLWRSASASGTFIAVPEENIDAGVVAVDCDARQPGIQDRCDPLIGDSIDIQVVLVAAPAGGYAGFDGKLTWTPRPARLTGLAALPPMCSLPAPTFGPTTPPLAILCSPTESSPYPAGTMAQIHIRCVESGELNLQLAGTVRAKSQELVDSTIVPSSIRCVRPLRGGLTSATGDANCDGAVNSVDASLVLQYTSDLSNSLECIASGDVDVDGTANSVDASLILQYTAGLLAHLPVS